MGPAAYKIFFLHIFGPRQDDFSLIFYSFPFHIFYIPLSGALCVLIASCAAAAAAGRGAAGLRG